MDWTEGLADDAENRRARLAAEVPASSSYHSIGEMVWGFVQLDGGCRTTFFNYLQRLNNGAAGKTAEGCG